MKKFSKVLLTAGIAFTLIGCQEKEIEKTEEEIMQEMEQEPEIIIPTEPVKTIEPQNEPAEVEIEDGEEGTF